MQAVFISAGLLARVQVLPAPVDVIVRGAVQLRADAHVTPSAALR